MSNADVDHTQAGSFGIAADRYQRGRPSYPDRALEWLIPSDAEAVVDLGAGTGQLSRQLQTYGIAAVIPIEPSAAMRDQLVRASSGLRAREGSAESIPVADHSVDAVFAAQSWHWVDPQRASAEVARVLRPGGVLGLLWNIRDEREEWVARLGDIMHRGMEQDMNSEKPTISTAFTPIQRFDVEWSWELDKSTLADLVASRSYFITAPIDVQKKIMKDVRELTEYHPALADNDRIRLPYITRCSRAFVSDRDSSLPS